MRESAERINELAVQLGREGMLEEAERLLRSAVRLHPQLTEAHFNLALLLEMQGRHQEALAHYQELLRRNPSDQEAFLGTGRCLAALGRLEEAARVFESSGPEGITDLVLVLMAQENDLLHPEHLGGTQLFLFPNFTQFLWLYIDIAGTFAAIGADHINNLFSLPHPLDHGAGHAKLSIIRVWCDD